MALAPTAANISVQQTLALLDGPFAAVAAGVAEDRSARYYAGEKGPTALLRVTKTGEKAHLEPPYGGNRDWNQRSGRLRKPIDHRKRTDASTAYVPEALSVVLLGGVNGSA